MLRKGRMVGGLAFSKVNVKKSYYSFSRTGKEKKECYYAETIEFLSGVGSLYTEFTDQRASRQISLLNGQSYASSCLQDYHPEIGYLLYDGQKEDLDISDSIKISQEEFERIWAQAVGNGDKVDK